MAKIYSETSRNELVELALAGLEVQIRELNDKKEELKQLLVSSPAAKRAGKAETVKAVKVARAGKGTKAGKKGVEAKTAKVAKSSKSVAADASEDGSGKKKRVFSAATRKKLREAAKARWAREKETKPAE
ncbi:MAG: hypothetical protein ACOYLN_04440 [Blastocatellia bacterium]|jgi:hypothetical protein